MGRGVFVFLALLEGIGARMVLIEELENELANEGEVKKCCCKRGRCDPGADKRARLKGKLPPQSHGAADPGNFFKADVCCKLKSKTCKHNIPGITNRYTVAAVAPFCAAPAVPSDSGTKSYAHPLDTDLGTKVYAHPLDVASARESSRDSNDALELEESSTDLGGEESVRSEVLDDDEDDDEPEPESPIAKAEEEEAEEDEAEAADEALTAEEAEVVASEEEPDSPVVVPKGAKFEEVVKVSAAPAGETPDECFTRCRREIMVRAFHQSHSADHDAIDKRCHKTCGIQVRSHGVTRRVRIGW